MRRLFLVMIAVISLVLVGSGVASAGGATPSEQEAFSPCITCHEDLAKDFSNNPHARGHAADKAICESCHGDATKHVDSGDAKLINVPKNAAGAAKCLGCHEGQKNHVIAKSGAHASGSVFCSTCHSVHKSAAAARPLLRKPVGEICVSCHLGEAGQFKKPFAHHLGGGMSCVTCHNPHGGKGERSLKTTALGEGPCITCHAEKNGPFVFSHVNGVAGNCMSCHEPHGSNNSKRLIRARADMLCLECHTTLPPTNLGSQPPAFHDMRSPRYQDCTTCHVAVHGSNTSPLLLK